MLEDLESVNWRELRHWWGTAEDIPELIRGLAAPEKAQREAAYSLLLERIDHQQELCQASSAVAPFLVELLDEEIEDKHLIVYLLTDLACGGYYDSLSKHWSDEAYAKVVMHKSRYEQLRTHPDNKVREAIEELLLALERRKDKENSEQST